MLKSRKRKYKASTEIIMRKDRTEKNIIISKGVRQGGALSATLFTIILKEIIRKVQIEGSDSNNIAVIAAKLKALQETFGKMKEKTQREMSITKQLKSNK